MADYVAGNTGITGVNTLAALSGQSPGSPTTAVDFAADGASGTVVGTGLGDSVNAGSGNLAVYESHGNNVVTFGTGIDQFDLGNGANTFVINQENGPLADSSGDLDQIIGFHGAGNGFTPGQDFLWLLNFGSGATLVFDGYAANNTSWQYYSVDDSTGADISGKFLVEMSDGSNLLGVGDYAFSGTGANSGTYSITPVAGPVVALADTGTTAKPFSNFIVDAVPYLSEVVLTGTYGVGSGSPFTDTIGGEVRSNEEDYSAAVKNDTELYGPGLTANSVFGSSVPLSAGGSDAIAGVTQTENGFGIVEPGVATTDTFSDTLSFTITGTHTGSGTITLGAADNGGYDITSITGTIDGQAITEYGGNPGASGAMVPDSDCTLTFDNIAYPGASPSLDTSGFVVQTTGGTTYDAVFDVSGNQYGLVQLSAPTSSPSTDTVNFTLTDQTPETSIDLKWDASVSGKAGSATITSAFEPNSTDEQHIQLLNHGTLVYDGTVAATGLIASGADTIGTTTVQAAAGFDEIIIYGDALNTHANDGFLIQSLWLQLESPPTVAVTGGDTTTLTTATNAQTVQYVDQVDQVQTIDNFQVTRGDHIVVQNESVGNVTIESVDGGADTAVLFSDYAAGLILLTGVAASSLTATQQDAHHVLIA